MALKVNAYITSSSGTNANTKLVDMPASSNANEESFENILELNQTALKAMTIDAMVADSPTGSINPASVDAAAIMAFRSKLPDNIVVSTPNGDASATISSKINSNSDDISNIMDIIDDMDSEDVDTDDIYNKGALKCSDQLNAYFKEAAKTYGVDAKLLKAIACVESNFNPSATSGSGAMGIMQMMPGTAKECGVNDPYDAYQSIMGGAKYISRMLDKFDGNVAYALAAYNAGANNVTKYGGVPPFEETQKYVNKVTNYYNS